MLDLRHIIGTPLHCFSFDQTLRDREAKKIRTRLTTLATNGVVRSDEGDMQSGHGRTRIKDAMYSDCD